MLEDIKDFTFFSSQWVLAEQANVIKDYFFVNCRDFK